MTRRIVDKLGRHFHFLIVDADVLFLRHSEVSWSEGRRRLSPQSSGYLLSLRGREGDDEHFSSNGEETQEMIIFFRSVNDSSEPASLPLLNDSSEAVLFL